MFFTFVIYRNVRSQIFPRSESFRTKFTNVWSFARVRPLGVSEMLLLSKTLIALFAFVGFFIVMNHLVVSQAFLRRHFSATSFANMPLTLSLVTRRYVILQVILNSVYFIANITLIRRLHEIFVVFLQVSFQGARITKTFFAHFTLIPYALMKQTMFAER